MVLILVFAVAVFSFPEVGPHPNRNRKPQTKLHRNRKDGFSVFALRFCCGCDFCCGFSFFQIWITGVTTTASANRTQQTTKPQPHIGVRYKHQKPER